MAPTTWLKAVGAAAPCNPALNTMIKSASRPIFRSAPIIETTIEYLTFPSALIAPASPRFIIWKNCPIAIILK